MASADWDAAAYHRISGPQFAWGLRVIERMNLRGDETVLDAGCGTGRLTGELLSRHPRLRAIALDASSAMLEQAQSALRPLYGERIQFLQMDLQHLELEQVADHIFSTATFHWVHDHSLLFAGLFRALRPGGRLTAQCGGRGNIARLRARAAAWMKEKSGLAKELSSHEPWHYASPEETERRLRAAGFDPVTAWLEEAPTRFDSAGSFREFVEKVIVRDSLSRLTEPDSKKAFLDALVAEAAQDVPSFELDYVRLNFAARRPGPT